MRRHAKASSAGSTSGTGSSRGLFGRAAATRGASSGDNGSGAPSRRLLTALLTVGLCVLAAVAAPAALASKSTVGAFTSRWTGVPMPKQISTGIAVNRNGAGGVTPSDVYVALRGKGQEQGSTIAEYSATGSFVRAFGFDVVSSGQDNTGANEQETATVKATGGTFSLTVTTALGQGEITSGTKTITGVNTFMGAFRVGDTITGGFIPANTTITAVGAGTLTLSANVTGTNVTGEFVANESTGSTIPYNATAGQLQAALEALPGVGVSGVTVSGGPGNETGSTPYTVTFSGGALKGNDVEQMTASPAGLTGGSPSSSVTVATTVSGGGPEVCNATSSPADVCKSSSEPALAGGLAGDFGLAIDQVTGNVYAVSIKNNRVDVFSAKGAYEGSFGWNVNAATPEEKVQFCTVVTGCKAGVTGAAAGQMNFANVPVNPAVSPVDGHLYVPDSGNQRVVEFAPTLNGAKEVTNASFVRAFGNDVIPTINEQQTVTLSGATGGSFTLSFKSQTTTMTGTGNVTSGSNEITGFASSASFFAGLAISGPGIPAGTTVTAINSGILTLSASATASASGATLTTSIPYNASATVVQKALRALSTVGESGSGNAIVTGSAGGPWTVELNGALAGVDQPQMTADGTGLTGASPSVAIATIQTGANGTNTGLEVCTVATTCKAGSNAGELTGVAVDSEGTIYTVANGSNPVQKYNPAATTVESFATAQLTGSGASGASTDIAIDPHSDHVFVAKKVASQAFKVFEFTRSGGFVDSSPAGTGTSTGNTNLRLHGLAIGTNERFYTSNDRQYVRILAPPPAPTATIEPASNITTTSVTVGGSVELPLPGAEGGYPTFYRFEYSSDGFTWSKFPAEEEIALGDGSGAGSPNGCPTGNPPKCNVSQTITGLQPNVSYAVRLTATTGTLASSPTITFVTKAAPPTISTTRAEPVSQTSATLTVFVNPNSQATSYHFEWGSSSTYDTRIPADFDPLLASGSQPVKVTAQVSGLSPDSVYHFRLVASNASGSTEGPDQEFITLNSAGLPDNRGFELVSPADKGRGGEVGDIPIVDFQTGPQAADDGNAFAVPLMNVSPATAGGFTRFLASRTDAGWQNTQVSAPSLIQPPRQFFEGTAPASKVLAFSSNLTCGVLASYNPLTADTPSFDIEHGIENLYRWNSDGSYTLLTNRVPANSSLAGEQITNVSSPNQLPFRTVAASSDCSRIYFESIFKYFNGGTTIYEWHDGTLRDAGLRHDGTPAGGPVGFGAQINQPDQGLVGSNFGTAGWHNAISEDGSRLYFNGTSDEGPDTGTNAVFLREDNGNSVTDVSQSTTAVHTLGARYEAASPDGSHVFFRANYGIASTSSPGATNVPCGGAPSPTQIEKLACDLYGYNADTKQLTDLSADTNPADPIGAAVQGVVAVSKDGSHVYFAAMGQLVPGKGRTYAQNATVNPSANVYLASGGQLKYVTNLAMGDLAGGGFASPLGAALIRSEPWSAAASSDGEKLLFEAATNITGYQSGNNDQEAYLYSASTGNVVCVSCRPDGLPSVHQSGFAIGPIVVQERRSASGYDFRPRSMNEAGTRIFFHSRDVLAPGAVSGSENVYEWEKGQIYFLTTLEQNGLAGLSGLLGSSASGNDVFVGTSKKLVPQDIDLVGDVYDIRVDGGFPPPPTPPTPCSPAQDECQGTPAPQPPSRAIGTGEFTGPGNPPTKHPKPKKPHKKHHKKGNKKAHKYHHNRAANTNRGGSK